MYLPEGRVIPAYSTWHPVDVSSQPNTSPELRARRRPIPARELLSRGETIVSLLGQNDGRLRRMPPEKILKFGSEPFAIPRLSARARPDRPRRAHACNSRRSVYAGSVTDRESAG